MIHISVTNNSINSKKLYNEIDQIVRDGIFSVDLPWMEEANRELMVSYLNSVMQEYWEQNVIEQWKIQCNTLNNTVDDMLQGKINLDIYYKQKNCLNTSRITYTLIE